MPQLVSRIGHNNPATVKILYEIIVGVLKTVPSQSVWHIAAILGK